MKNATEWAGVVVVRSGGGMMMMMGIVAPRSMGVAVRGYSAAITGHPQNPASIDRLIPCIFIG
jgi:hypothetical protein